MSESDKYIHWAETCEGGTSCDTSKTHLSDGGVHDTLLSKFVHEALGDLYKQPLYETLSHAQQKAEAHLVCTIVTGDLLTDDEHLLIS